MNVLVKKIDEYRSKLNKSKIIFEYIIYLRLGDSILEAYTAIGEEDKDSTIKMLFERYWTNELKEIIN